METLKIALVTIGGKNYLQFDFVGDLTESVAIQGIATWRKEINAFPVNEKIGLIYNCTKMTGFETEARRNWQNAMKEFKNRLGEIWIVSENIFILGAAKTMGVLTGFNMKVCRSLNDISK